MARKKKWIQQTEMKKGALRSLIKSRYGKKGFTKEGKIKQNVLQKMAREKTKRGKTTTAARRARLALTLQKF